jgi:medium-chain acyl-[acyl-carrier-protein] hydrolase
MEKLQMPESPLDIHTRPFLVRYSETDCDCLLKPLKVFDYFQDTAMEHAHHMGVSGIHLRPRNLAWFVVYYQVQFFTLPGWNQNVSLKTWRYPERGLYEIRCYEMRDSQEQLMIQGRSVLVIIDTERKKPVRLKQALPPEQLIITVPSSKSYVEIPVITQPEIEQFFSIRKQDLDFNGHVNNTVFIGWALENVPESAGTRFIPNEVEVNYLSDIKFGQTVKALGQALTGGAYPSYLYQIIDNQDNRETTRMRISWQPIPSIR